MSSVHADADEGGTVLLGGRRLSYAVVTLDALELLTGREA
jgi:hypothetical protein